LNDTYLALGQFDRAEHQVRQALAIRQREHGAVHPTVAESSYYLAATMRRQRLYAESLEAYRSALDIERHLSEPTANYPYALNEAAGSAARIGLHAQAASLMREALGLAWTERPGLKGFLLTRSAWCLAEAGELDGAETQTQQAEQLLLRAGPDSTALRSFARSSRAAVAWFGDDLERAEEISNPPINSWVAFWRAQALYDLGRFDEALRLVQPESGESEGSEQQVLLGRLVLASSGDVGTCLARIEPALAFEEAVAMGPTWYLAEARAALAACLVARGEPADLVRAEKLLVLAKETLDSLFDRPTPLHRRIAAATAAGPGAATPR
jgi:hypothetical protein